MIAVEILRPTSRQPSTSQMIKSLAASATLILLVVSVLALPGVVPGVGASETAASAKEDRLAIRSTSANCARQVWPHFDGSCLHYGEAAISVEEARLIRTQR
jgi:hypothetical protein